MTLPSLGVSQWVIQRKTEGLPTAHVLSLPLKLLHKRVVTSVEPIIIDHDLWLILSYSLTTHLSLIICIIVNPNCLLMVVVFWWRKHFKKWIDAIPWVIALTSVVTFIGFTIRFCIQAKSVRSYPWFYRLAITGLPLWVELKIRCDFLEVIFILFHGCQSDVYLAISVYLK